MFISQELMSVLPVDEININLTYYLHASTVYWIHGNCYADFGVVGNTLVAHQLFGPAATRTFMPHFDASQRLLS